MKIILNNRTGVTTFKEALAELVEGASTLSVAVSYLQVGGWGLFEHHTHGLNYRKMRIICTDQMGITPPAAVKMAQSSGVQIRNFTGETIYHPKVYLAYDNSGNPMRFLLGSANLSSSAFTNSVEAGVLSEERTGLYTLCNWFEDLYKTRSEEFTEASLLAMEKKWLAAAANRARARLRVRRLQVLPTEIIPLTAEDIDTLEDIFATVKLPIGLLNMDYAANNIRNIERVREVLADWTIVKSSNVPKHGKQRSELKLLGFVSGNELSPLGKRASKSSDVHEIARLWCAWLQQTPDAELEAINRLLPVAKRVLRQFFRLKKEVRDYFLKHAQRPKEDEKKTLQMIELLCNASDVVQELSLEDVEALVPLLEHPERLPEFIDKAVIDYRNNKGMRGWDFPDRLIVPLAWDEISRE